MLALVDSLHSITKRFKKMTKPETDDASNRFGDKLSFEIISILSIVRQLLYQHIETSIV